MKSTVLRYLPYLLTTGRNQPKPNFLAFCAREKRRAKRMISPLQAPMSFW